VTVIRGIHLLLYSTNPAADRGFFRDVLGFRAVDAGEGWLIFGLPPAELGVHPGDGTFVQRHAEGDLLGTVVYLMCDDVRALTASLEAQHVNCTPLVQAEWGITTTVRLPSGGWIGLYQPTHPTALDER
jgi:catechol 2,3-dioxygenase-like lactoylglutathione lyase family enzyme